MKKMFSFALVAVIEEKPVFPVYASAYYERTFTSKLVAVVKEKGAGK